MLQLDFFQTDEEILNYEIRKIKESTDKVRKGIFARHNELAKMYLELSDRLTIIERNLCKKS